MIQALITEMYAFCAPAQMPEGAGLNTMARIWARGLAPVPDAQLRPVYELALRQHSQNAAGRRFPLVGTEFLGAWEDLLKAQAEQAEVQRRYAADTRLALPAPDTATPPTPDVTTTLPALLAAVARAIGDTPSTLDVIHADHALRKHDPAADVRTWRARLDSARAADSAPTLNSLVAALLPAPVESEAAP
jgi:hypothetical protein